ncbi:MAG: FxsA family protein [Haloarculaceae archaeon]
MDLRVIGVLLLVPLLDLLLLVVVADFVGLVPTVALVVLTALLGMLFVRAEGRHTIRKIQEKTARGDLPTDELLDGGLLLIAGAFLLTPGIVTDALGFLLAIPVTRYPVRVAVKRYVAVPYIDAKTGGFATGDVWTQGFPEGAYDVPEDDYHFDDVDDDRDSGPGSQPDN